MGDTTNIVIFCHRSVEKNKEKLIADLVKASVLQKAKSLNKNVTHYVIDIELTDKTKEMRKVKERQKNNAITIKNSKWLHLKLKDFKTGNVENSITRARKRKYGEPEHDGIEFEEEVQIGDFSEDEDFAKLKQKKRRKMNKKKQQRADIRKHIIMKHRIGVLLTGIS